MDESRQVVGRAKTVLVSGMERAVISDIVAHRTERRAGKRRLHFRGTVEFKDSVKRHIREMILPIVDGIVDTLGLARKNFELSAVNLGAASAVDVGLNISGFSVDVPILVAMLSAVLQVSISNDFVSTGHIASVEGDIRTVKGIPVKVEVAINDSSIKHFLYGDVEKDKSLKVLSPNEMNRSISAIMAARDSVRTEAVSGIEELIRLVFTEESIVMASLKEGFFGISIKPEQSNNSIQNVVSFLTNNNEKRLCDILQRHFINNNCGKGKEFLRAYAQFFIRRQEYPAGFGARLLQLVRSLPPAARPKKIFPLFDEDLYIELSNLAEKSDYSDRLTLSDAVYGRNITSKTNTCLVNPPPEIKMPDGDYDCIAFDMVVSQIKERAIAEHVGIPIDSARGSFILESSIVETFEGFVDSIVAYYIHIQRYISSSPDKATDMTMARTEAIALLQRTFRDKGGDQTAFAMARDGVKGGIRTILDALTEQYKAEKSQAYIELVFTDAIEALGWDERVRCIRGLIKRAGGSLPKEIRDEPPERFARNYKSLLRIYVKSFDNVEQLLRTM